MSWDSMGFILYRNCYELGNHGIHSVLFLPVGDSFCYIPTSWDFIGFILLYSYQLGSYRIHSVIFLPVGIS
jgi:hypothetical protein